MNRLTKKSNSVLEAIEYQLIDEKENLDANEGIKKIPVLATNKLGRLEDIEEELGCPLEVVFKVFKALKDGQVIVKHIVGLKNPKTFLEAHKIAELLFDGKNYGLWIYDNGYGDEFRVYTKDYGKTWALTKEELENDN